MGGRFAARPHRLDGTMQQQTILILGGSGGIGSALARALSRDGANVVVTGRDSAKLSQIASETGVSTRILDALTPGSIEACVTQTAESYGRIDAAVNCLGSVVLKPAHLTQDAEWDAVLALNLTTCFRLLRAVIPVMTAQGGGAIAFCSSVAAQRGLMNHEAIAAAKAGVEGLTRSAAATYSKAQIRVNAVAPGLVMTPLTQRFWSQEAVRKASEQMHPLGKLGEPEQIASALQWLISPVQSWVTGQVISVDGGMGVVQARA